MKCLLVLGAIALLHLTLAQKQQQYTTPVPILKQINKHNEDGSYSYGYEGADGTFKIETKYADGEVYGKYGYVDDGGKVREVEYGASRRGFEPAGNGINVAPPTLRAAANEYQAPLRPGEEDDGQYREDPAVYYKDEAYNKPAYQQQQPQYQQQQPQYQQPQYQQPQPQYQRPKPAYREPAPVQQYQEPEPAPVYQPRPQPAFRPQAQPAFRPQAQQQQGSSYDFEDFRSSLGFSKTRPAPAPAPAPAPQPVYRPAPAPVTNYNNYDQGYSRPSSNYNNGYSNNWWSPGNNYNSGYSNNYNQGYRQPIAHEPLPFNVDLNTGSYSLNVGRR